MALFSQGDATLALGGKVVLRSSTAADAVTRSRVALAAGTHDVRLVYRVRDTRGGIEWSWTPPGEEESIVPPAALRPPRGAGVGRPLPRAMLAALASEPDVPILVTVR